MPTPILIAGKGMQGICRKLVYLVGMLQERCYPVGTLQKNFYLADFQRKCDYLVGGGHKNVVV